MQKAPIKKHSIVTLLLILVMSNAVYSQDEKLVFSPHWMPQAQFAGFYVALDQGFYNEVGLEVEIIHPSANISSLQLLNEGKADVVSSFLMDAMKLRADGLPLVNFAQLSQHSALMLVTKKSSGITTPAHMEGKKLGIWSSGFDDIPFAFLREKEIEMDIVRIHGTINLFLMEAVDVMTVMNYNEYNQIINSGINEDELTTFYFADYGYDIPEDGLYCLETTWETRKESLRKFAEATTKGWEYAADNKEYTIDLVVEEMQKAHLPNNKPHQRWMFDRLLELNRPTNKRVSQGQLLRSDFQHALDIINLNREGEVKQLKMEEFFME
ncbi:MAG: ABC transporter substrate-binding protein [bacterium]|nr:ABC transporter substrate-binding protein [bacterium]MDD3968809.1 ABC transporter substrate-binding protein [Proteiniphilum sp.]MDD4459889.1 ABC transporter substrate-binding protein [Proteiniphilum sp.]